jgi:hypothetical protein
MSRNPYPFTREDEKVLLKDGVDLYFLDGFRGSYSNSSKSCSVAVIIDLNHVTVDEIESWEPDNIKSCYDRYSTKLKLPDNVRNSSSQQS